MEALGVIAIILATSAYIWKSPRQIMVLSAASSATWVLYFMSISQWGPMFVTLTFFLVLLSGAFGSDRTVRLVALGRLLFIVPTLFVTMTGIPMLLVLGGSFLKTVGPLLRGHPYLYRIALTLSEALWLSFGVLEAVYPTVVGSGIAIAATLGSGAYFFWMERRSSLKVAASR